MSDAEKFSVWFKIFQSDLKFFSVISVSLNSKGKYFRVILYLYLYWILCNSPKLDLRKGDSNGPKSPLPHTLEPRVDECSFEVQSTVPGWSPALFE